MRFVTPDVVRIPLNNPDEDWIEVKRELSTGEEKRFRSRGLHRMTGVGRGSEDAAIDINWTDMALARVEAYLVDWSAKNPTTGKDIPVTRQAIENLSNEDFELIDNAIQAHMAAMLEEKKVRSGSLTPTSLTT